MQFCHFCGMHSFVSGPLFQFASLQQAYKTARPNARRWQATATSWGAVRPSSPPRPASCAACAGHGHVPGGSAIVLAAAPAAASARRRRRCVRLLRCSSPRGWHSPRPHPARSSASLLWTSLSMRQSRQVSPAAATSASALRASKFHSTAGKLQKAYQIMCKSKRPFMQPRI